MTIADLKPSGTDAMGAPIRVIYGLKPREYAVYRTEERVLVQFADAPERANEQRKALARLNPLRGEINGLIDGWRTKPRRARRAEWYDRRVGDALVVALEDDVPSAETLLDHIKQDILGDRVALGRFWYLSAAFAFGLATVVVTTLVRLRSPDRGGDLLSAAMTGAVGAFFSIAIGIRGRTILPDLRWGSNVLDAALRMVIGLIAGAVLIALVAVGAVNITLGRAALEAPSPSDHWLFVLIVGFIAGFSERFVPDLLAKATGPTDAQPAPKAAAEPVQPAAEPQPRADGARPAEKPKDEDPLPEEGAADTCTVGVGIPADKVTPDAELPPASGGVAKPEAA